MNLLKDRLFLAIGSLVLAVIFFVAVNALSANVFRSTSVDFTKDGVYTLSPGTRKVLADLKEPITLRFFLSPRLSQVRPDLGKYGERVLAVLERFARLSNGKVKLEINRPRAFSVEEDRAAALGLVGLPVDQSGEQVFFGLAATNSVDERKTIPVFHPSRERFIEFDLTRLIRGLDTPQKAVIGVISRMPIQGRFSPRGLVQPWPIYQRIKDLYDVRPLRQPARIPDEIKLLLVIHPFALPEQTRYAIDQFVLRGGKLIVLADPLPETAPRRRTFMGAGPVPPGSNLPELFKAWGIQMIKDRVVTDPESAPFPVEVQYQGRKVRVPLITLLAIRKDEIDRRDPITRGLQRVIFNSPGGIVKIDGGTTEVQGLVRTKGKSMLVDVNRLRYRPDLARIIISYQTRDKSKDRGYSLAVRVTGKAKSAFPKGPPESAKPKKKEEKKAGDKKDAKKPADKKDAKKEPKKPEPKHLAESAKPIDVIVIADVDWIASRYWQGAINYFGNRVTVPLSDNGNMLMNAMDLMTGTNAFVGLRQKGARQRQFTKIAEMKQRAEATQRQKTRKLIDEIKQLRDALDPKKAKTKEGSVELTEAEKQKRRDIRKRLLEARAELRLAKFEERRELEAEEAKWKFVNIGLMPIGICVIAVFVGVVRRRRRRATIREATGGARA